MGGLILQISSNIDEVIKFLQSKKRDGYKSVEIIDDARERGWHYINPTIEFIFCEQEPSVLGIDVRKNKISRLEDMRNDI